MKNNKPIPTLVLKDLIDKDVLKYYNNLHTVLPRWILCQHQIDTIDSFVFSTWKERLFFECLEQKSNAIETVLCTSNNNYEAILFQLLAENFGLKVNGEVFFKLAKSIDFSIIRKEQFNPQKLSVLLFGQAAFFEDDLQIEYFLLLKKEYAYLRHKYNLNPILNKQFSFFRMRPNNFPTIRIAQLVALLSNQ